jgi:hypothetical protein
MGHHATTGPAAVIGWRRRVISSDRGATGTWYWLRRSDGGRDYVFEPDSWLRKRVQAFRAKLGR